MSIFDFLTTARFSHCDLAVSTKLEMKSALVV